MRVDAKRQHIWAPLYFYTPVDSPGTSRRKIKQPEDIWGVKWESSQVKPLSQWQEPSQVSGLVSSQLLSPPECGHGGQLPVGISRQAHGQCTDPPMQSATAGPKAHSGGMGVGRGRCGNFYCSAEIQLASPSLHRSLLPREKPWNVRNALQPPAQPLDGEGFGSREQWGTFPAISGSLGHQGAHTRHHLLALGSGLSGTELSQVLGLGVMGPLLGSHGLCGRPLTQHHHPWVWVWALPGTEV